MRLRILHDALVSQVVFPAVATASERALVRASKNCLKSVSNSSTKQSSRPHSKKNKGETLRCSKACENNRICNVENNSYFSTRVPKVDTKHETHLQPLPL